MSSICEKLRVAVKYKMDADDVTIMIDEQAIIDTANTINKNTLMMADIELTNDATITMNEIREADRVIYWKAGDGICGLAWNKNGVHFFSGSVLTP